MKKITLLLIISQFAFANAFFSQTPAKQHVSFLKSVKSKSKSQLAQSRTTAAFAPGKSVNYYWDNFSNSWTLNDTSVYNYNTSGLLSEVLTRNGTPYNRTLYTYDSKGREILRLDQNWDNFNSVYKDSYRSVTSYDSHDNQIEYTSESYDNTLSQWVINYGNKNIITYNASNQITSNTSQNWDSNTDTWKDSNKYTNYIYNSGGHATQIDYQVKSGSLWINDSRELYIYSIANVMVEAEYQTWNGVTFDKSEKFGNITWLNWTGDLETSNPTSYTTSTWGSPIPNQWNVSGRNTTSYDAFGGNVSTDQVYTNSVWVNDYRYSLIYDTKSNETGYRSETWQTGNSTWQIDGENKQIHTYDGSNNITETIWQYWQSSSSSLVNTQKKVYSDFKSITGINEQSAKSNLIVTVYPNPIQSSFTIRLTDKHALLSNVVSLKIYDLVGKEISETTLSGNETTISRGNLNAGVYFYSIRDKNTVLATGKLLVD